MKTVINIVLVIILSWMVGVINVHAQTCKDNIIPTTPDERFINNGDGTVIDKQTGLIWMRCSLGQAWDEQGQTCSGEAITYTWQEALRSADGYTYAGSSAWRVPDIMQLQSIVEDSCDQPAINLYIFPQTPSDDFWTASSFANDEYEAWGVSFYGGTWYPYFKIDSRYVRLVRSSSN